MTLFMMMLSTLLGHRSLDSLLFFQVIVGRPHSKFRLKQQQQFSNKLSLSKHTKGLGVGSMDPSPNRRILLKGRERKSTLTEWVPDYFIPLSPTHQVVGMYATHDEKVWHDPLFPGFVSSDASGRGPWHGRGVEQNDHYYKRISRRQSTYVTTRNQSPTLGAHSCPWVLGGHGCDIIVHGWA